MQSQRSLILRPTTPQNNTTTLLHRPTGLTIILPADSNGWFYFSPGGISSILPKTRGKNEAADALAAGGEASSAGAAGCGSGR